MTEEEKDTQTTPSEEAQTEPKTGESVSEQEVVQTVPGTTPEVTTETQTAHMGGNEPFGSFPKVDRTFESDSESKERQPEQSKYERNEALPQTGNDGAEAIAEASGDERSTSSKEEREAPKQDEPNQKELFAVLQYYL